MCFGFPEPRRPAESTVCGEQTHIFCRRAFATKFTAIFGAMAIAADFFLQPPCQAIHAPANAFASFQKLNFSGLT